MKLPFKIDLNDNELPLNVVLIDGGFSAYSGM